MHPLAPAGVCAQLFREGVVGKIGISDAGVRVQRGKGRMRLERGAGCRGVGLNRRECRRPVGEAALRILLARLRPLVGDFQKFIAGIREVRSKPDAGAQIEIAFPDRAFLVRDLGREVRAASLELHRHHAGFKIDSTVWKRGARQMKHFRVVDVSCAERNRRLGSEEQRKLAVKRPAGTIRVVLVEKRICDDRVDAAALERLGETVWTDYPADDLLYLALGDLAAVIRERAAVPASGRHVYSFDAERRRPGELRLDPADHRHSLGRRHCERNRNAVRVEIVGKRGHAKAAEPVVPRLGLLAWRHLRLVERGCARKHERTAILEIRHLVRLVAAIREVVRLDGVVAIPGKGLLALWEPAVRHEGHRGIRLKLGGTLGRIEAPRPGLDVFGKGTLHLANRALVAKGEVEVSN